MQRKLKAENEKKNKEPSKALNKLKNNKKISTMNHNGDSSN